MKRLLAAAALATTPLLAIATPAAAAPPEHIVDSACVVIPEDFDQEGYIFCYDFDAIVRTTVTPSGIVTERTSGTYSMDVTFDSGFRFGNSQTWDRKFVFKQGETHVDFERQNATYYEGDSTCTFVSEFLITNGETRWVNVINTCDF